MPRVPQQDPGPAPFFAKQGAISGTDRSANESHSSWLAFFLSKHDIFYAPGPPTRRKWMQRRWIGPSTVARAVMLGGTSSPARQGCRRSSSMPTAMRVTSTIW